MQDEKRKKHKNKRITGELIMSFNGIFIATYQILSKTEYNTGAGP
jgi:hypothetical protein